MERVNHDLAGMRIVITGGAGMLGSTIAAMAVRRGAKVTVLDALLPLYGGNLFNLDSVKDQIAFVHGDIRDKDCVRAAVQGQEVVFNLAAQVSYVDSNLDPHMDVEINCHGILNVLEACRAVSPTARVIFSSSRFVYGRIEVNPVGEEHPFNCLSIYGIHKLAGEKYHRYFFDAYGIPTTSLRIANPYGPRQQMRHSKYGILNWFIRQALDGNALTIYGDGVQKRDYVFVEDVAEGMLTVAQSQATVGEVYNIGSGQGTPFITMAQTIATQISGTVIRQVEWPKDRYFVETGDFVADISRLEAATGWHPSISIEEGIAKTVAYYREHHDRYWQANGLCT